MGYRVLLEGDDWLEDMVDKYNFGCTDISVDDLPLSDILIGSFDYTANDPYSYEFTVPMAESEEEIVLYAKGTFIDGEVTILTSEVSRLGFTVKAAIDCKVSYIIGYKND